MAATAIKRPNTRAAATSAWLFQGEITALFQDADTEVGVRSVMGAQLEAAGSGVVSEPTYDYDAKIVNVIASGTVRRQRVAWLTLREMLAQGLEREVVVLHLLYGHVRYPDLLGFGDLAPIAHLTEMAEDARAELALQEGERSMARVAVTFSPEALEWRRNAIAAAFWRIATKASKLERKSNRAASKGDEALAADLWREVERQWRHLGDLLREYHHDPVPRALAGACAHADAIVTPRDALRHWTTIAPPKRPQGKDGDPQIKAWKLAVDEHTASKALIVHLVRDQAEKLKAAAMVAYAEARKVVTR